MFHLSCFLFSGDKQRQQVCIQVLIPSHAHTILFPLMQGEVRKIYSSLPRFGGMQTTFEESHCIANSFWVREDPSVRCVCEGQTFAAWFLLKEARAAAHSEVSTRKANMQGAEEGKPLVQ